MEKMFKNLSTPEYLKEIDPALYQEQSARVSRQFEQSLQLAEQAFAREFRDMLDRLAERLTPGEDGKTKVLRASVVDNMKDFIAKFKSLHVTSSHELDALVDQATMLVGGLDPQQLRDSEALRSDTRKGVEEIGKALEANVYLPPRRKITKKGVVAPTPVAEQPLPVPAVLDLMAPVAEAA